MADLLRGLVAVSAEELDWDGLEVLRDLDGEPHLLTRVQLSGGHFPHRALEPFLLVGKVRSRIVEVSEDGRLPPGTRLRAN
jgi:hypothetical protein